jgi:O-antigen ligase
MDSPASSTPQIDGLEHSRRRRSRRHSSRSSGAFAERWEFFSGFLLCLLALVTPWLYGTTENWSIRLMTAASFCTALCILPMPFRKREAAAPKESGREKFLKYGFLGLNVALLAFTLIAYLNARATFSIDDRSFTYRENVIPWLPTSYDRARTGEFLLNSLALCLIFWSARSWLGRGWRFENRSSDEHGSRSASSNRRISLLLWLLAINGFALSVQGIFQRLTHSPRLLWMRMSWWQIPESCFGPFSYRGNAADYLNLIWPLTFGLWHALSSKQKKPGRLMFDGPELLLFPMFLVTAAATFISLSRGASLVAALMLLVLSGILLARARSGKMKVTVVLGIVAIFGFVIAISRAQLSTRFKEAVSDNLSGRSIIYDNAKQIAADYPVFGTGPGTFQSVYHMYRESAKQDWQAFVHDDWLETRATFGWVGFSLVILQFGLLACWAAIQRQRWTSRILPLCLFISLGGCLLHAKADFPFQIYSIVFTFVIVAALLTSLAPPPNIPVESSSAIS